MSGLTGSCLCGANRFSLQGELHLARYCHCANCRKFSGTSPAAWAMAASFDLDVISSDAAVGRYESGAGVRCFCSRCGSPLWFEPAEHPDVVGIPLGVIDGEGVPEPEMHLWVRSMPAWAAIRDGLPRHETGP